MTQDVVLTIMQQALKTVIITASPPLLIGLVVGLIISIFQTVTSINEQTLTFVPKILAVFLSLIIFGAFMLTQLQQLFVNLYSNFVTFIS